MPPKSRRQWSTRRENEEGGEIEAGAEVSRDDGEASDAEDGDFDAGHRFDENAMAVLKRGPRRFDPIKPYIKLNDRNSSRHTAISSAQARFFSYLCDVLVYKYRLFPRDTFKLKDNGNGTWMTCEDREFRSYVDTTVADARRLLRRNQLNIFEACILDAADSIITGFRVYAITKPQFVNKAELFETYNELFHPVIARLNFYKPNEEAMKRIKAEETRFEIRMRTLAHDEISMDELEVATSLNRLKPLFNPIDTETHTLSIWKMPMNKKRTADLVPKVELGSETSRNQNETNNRIEEITID